MRFYLNNAIARNHARLYPVGAFFDLHKTGRQGKMARDLQVGDECVVATPIARGDIEFSWFRFSHERELDIPDEPGGKGRVLFGTPMEPPERLPKRLPKAIAAEAEPYSVFFNTKGHFKRWSVIRPRDGRRRSKARQQRPRGR